MHRLRVLSASSRLGLRASPPGVLLPVLFLLFGPSVFAQEGKELHDPPSVEGKSLLRFLPPGGHRPLGPERFPAPDPNHDFDVLHYDVSVTVVPGVRHVEGVVEMTFQATRDGLDSILVHALGLVLDSVKVGGVPVGYAVTGDRVRISLGGAIANGAIRTSRIKYHGDPMSGLFFVNTRYGQPIIYTVNEPSDVRRWIPCYDEPWDKATATVHARVPAAQRVAGNGVLTSVVAAGTDSIHTWTETHPLSTYLIAIDVFPYSILKASAGNIPLRWYLYPQDTTNAKVDFANVPDMLSFYCGFHPYPFDKYGMAEAPFGGGMENQTMTVFGEFLIRGNKAYEWVVAHELAHQWWGDLVTCRDWRNIWLNEGFATYFDYLYTEHKYGAAPFQTRLNQGKASYFNEDSLVARYAIYDPPADRLFGTTEYTKGAWVLHMLRRVVGEADFHAIFPAYATAHALGTAETADFQAVCEGVSGEDLDWFFEEWIYRKGFPEYRWNWYSQDLGDGTWNVYVYVNQIQLDVPAFRMPVDFLVKRAAGDTLLTGLVDQNGESLVFTVPGAPTDVLFDPGNWILKKIARDTALAVLPPEEGAPGPIAFVRAWPSPAVSGARIRVSLSPGVARPARLRIYDAGGRLLRTAYEGVLGPGTYDLPWDGTADRGGTVSPGVYFYAFTYGAESRAGKITLVRR